MQQITMKCHHLLPIRMVKIKTIITTVGRDVEELEPSYVASENFHKLAAATLEKSLVLPQNIEQSYYITKQFHS